MGNNFDRIYELRQRHKKFDKFCHNKTIHKRVTQATILSIMWSGAVALPTYTYMNTDHPAIQIGSAVYGLMIGILGPYYPMVISERTDDEICTEAKKLELILDEEH